MASEKEIQRQAVEEFLDDQCISRWDDWIMRRKQRWMPLVDKMVMDDETGDCDIPNWISELEDIQRRAVKEFLDGKVNREFRDWIMSREQRWMSLVIEMVMDDDTGDMDIQEWDSELANLQHQAVTECLCDREVNEYLRDLIMNQEDIWKPLVDKMVMIGNTGHMRWNIPDWDNLWADIQHQASKAFLDERVNPHWKDWILSRDDICRRLKVMIDDTNIWELSVWDSCFADLQQRVLCTFLTSKGVAAGWKNMIMKTYWCSFADEMTFDPMTREMNIAKWDTLFAGWQYRRVDTFLASKGVTNDWKKWIMEEPQHWRDLANKMTFDEKKEERKISNWDNTFADLQSRGVREFLESEEVYQLLSEEVYNWTLGTNVIWRDLADKGACPGNTLESLEGITAIEEYLIQKFDVWSRVKRSMKSMGESCYNAVQFASWIMIQNTAWRHLANIMEEEWVDTISDRRQRLLIQFLEENHVAADWQDFIMKNDDLKRILTNSIIRVDVHWYKLQRRQLHPSRDKVLAAFRHCPFNKLKVIVFGEDPRKPLATGLAFSYPVGMVETDIHHKSAIIKIHDVLRNIQERATSARYEKKKKKKNEKKKKKKKPKPHQTSCCHVNWAKQGVLLLNSALTFTRQDHKAAHKTIWQGFMQVLLNALLVNFRSQGLDVLCWSAASRSLANKLDTSKKIKIYKGPHPAERGGKFANAVKDHLTAINTKYLDIFRLDDIYDEVVEQVANKLDDEIIDEGVGHVADESIDERVEQVADELDDLDLN